MIFNQIQEYWLQGKWGLVLESKDFHKRLGIRNRKKHKALLACAKVHLYGNSTAYEVLEAILNESGGSSEENYFSNLVLATKFQEKAIKNLLDGKTCSAINQTRKAVQLIANTKIQRYIKARLNGEVKRLNLGYSVYSTSDFKIKKFIFRKLHDNLYSLGKIKENRWKPSSIILKIAFFLNEVPHVNKKGIYILKQLTTEGEFTVQQKLDKQMLHKEPLLISNVQNLLKLFDHALMENKYEEAKSYLELCFESNFCFRLIKEFLSMRILESIALHELAVENYIAFSSAINQIMSLHVLALLSNGNSGWYLDFANHTFYYTFFDQKDNLTDWVTLFNTNSKLNECSKHVLLLLVGNYYKSKGNKLKATHCYSLSIYHSRQSTNRIRQSINALMSINQYTQALELSLNKFVHSMSGTENDKHQLRGDLNVVTRKYKPLIEHGHRLLISMIKNNWSFIKCKTQKPLVLIEVGSTRELTANQGSTEKLAYFCNDYNIHFITVDMDPNNIANVEPVIKKINSNFEAITAKGEEFLASYDGEFDFAFLDAYDFNHGKHSEDRQKPYIKVLGERINDKACHEMHLLCAKALAFKLRSWGIIVFDDVWYKDGHWNGKGTTGVPYLTNQGFEIVQSTNNAVALVRSRSGVVESA